MSNNNYAPVAIRNDEPVTVTQMGEETRITYMKYRNKKANTIKLDKDHYLITNDERVLEDGEDVIDVWDTIADLHSKACYDKDGGNKYVEQFEELYKEVCDKKGKLIFSRNVSNEIWNEMVSESVCKDCFAEILKKCGEES